ncbi:hypothetical protein SAMN05445756_1432 [Kytococcus aerolatus]|uniref:Secreted protein n=1 Tax=Kytococcus aerolatus TaxID=592308 RepID=A0A212TZC2_9MICO|nr:hypothetical protein [Kytococcus aerolatus]SNC71329.1 hypothetical protein SAMN05445756_1432 [Kytococcus aerolatus]
MNPNVTSRRTVAKGLTRSAPAVAVAASARAVAASAANVYCFDASLGSYSQCYAGDGYFRITNDLPSDSNGMVVGPGWRITEGERSDSTTSPHQNVTRNSLTSTFGLPTDMNAPARIANPFTVIQGEGNWQVIRVAPRYVGGVEYQGYEFTYVGPDRMTTTQPESLLGSEASAWPGYALEADVALSNDVLTGGGGYSECAVGCDSTFARFIGGYRAHFTVADGTPVSEDGSGLQTAEQTCAPA